MKVQRLITKHKISDGELHNFINYPHGLARLLEEGWVVIRVFDIGDQISFGNYPLTTSKDV